MSVETYTARLSESIDDLRTGERDAVDYVDVLCNRIDEVDADLRSLVTECDRRGRLRTTAANLRERYPDPSDRPPLFGVPVGIKDIIHVDGFETRAGTALPPELFAGPEASCVKRLRNAGALVLGKTVTTEFAGAAPGLTRNPHDTGHTPGGSSSGSVAAVAAGLCPLALGTQTGGSVIRPAAFCGVVGMKPSFDRIPCDGVVEVSESADHLGMFTQDIAGMQSAASVLCDDWNPSEHTRENSLAIGVPEGTYLKSASEEAINVFESQLGRLEKEGFAVRRVKVPTFEEFEALIRRHRRLMQAELAFVHQEWFDDYASFYRTPTAESIENGRKVTVSQLAQSRASRIALREELEELLESHDLNVWAAPASRGPAPETIRSTGDPVMNIPWTHAGLPVVSLPVGESENGLPLGIQFAGPFMADEQLLSWAERLADAL